MNETKALPLKSAANRFWTSSIGLVSFLSAVFARFLLFFAAAEERSLLRSSTFTGGIVLMLAGAIYGGAEVVRRLRGRPPHIHLPLGTLFILVVFLSGGLLIVNGSLARKRSAATRVLEELRVTNEAIAHPSEQPTPDAK